MLKYCLCEHIFKNDCYYFLDLALELEKVNHKGILEEHSENVARAIENMDLNRKKEIEDRFKI